MASLKNKVDNLDKGKLKTVLSGLITLSNVGDNNVFELQNDKLVIKVNANDTKITSTSGLFTETY